MKKLNLSTYVILLELRNPRKDYPKLLEYLKSFEGTRLSQSAYIIKSEGNVFQVGEELRSRVDEQDQILVMNMGEGVIEWIGRNIPDSKIREWLESEVFAKNALRDGEVV